MNRNISGDNFNQIKKAFNGFYSKLFNSYSFIVTLKNMDQNGEIIKAEIPITTRLLTKDDVSEYCKTSGEKSVKVSQRLSGGHLCWCAFHGEKLVSYVWRGVNEVWVAELKALIRLPSGYYFAYGAFTHPDYRGLHVFGELLSSWNIYGREQLGFTNSFAIISPDNVPSLKASYATGQRRVGLIRTRLILGVPLHSVECESSSDLNLIKSHFKLNLISERLRVGEP